MRARGADFLKIPDNYYDDIEAKYDLDAATMSALRDNQILYDREGEANSSRSIPTRSMSGSFSRSCNGAIIRALVLPMPLFALRRRRGNPGC